MELNFIKYEKRGHIAYITLNRPEVMNALHPPCHQEMAQVWDDFMADRAMWVAIITGAGDKAFSAGNDLKHTAQHGSERISLPNGGFAGITSRFDLTKPIIAAVNGFALGGGFEIALACDIIVAAEHARFGLPEPRVGLMAGAGGVQRLPRQIPLKIAMGMILTGKHITAQEALRLGIANEVVPLKELPAAADRWAAEIMECAPISVQTSKEAAMSSLDQPLEGVLEAGKKLFGRVLRTQDAKEGPIAFSQKRKPTWKAE